MKRIVLLLLTCCAMMACKKIDVDFSYSPDQPKAGEKVTFTNLSTGGEEWAWTFGDGSTSTLKSPTYTYKNPGTYTVTLKVDGKSSRTKVHEITVYDTIPTYSASDSAFAIYKDYSFQALVYNPYNYEVKYLWYQPVLTEGYESPYFVVTDTTTRAATLHLYFTRPMTEARLGLLVVLNGDTTRIEKSFLVSDRETNSVVFRNAQGDYRQRIFGQRAEDPRRDASAKALLDAEQDTAQLYNGKWFKMSELKPIFPELLGFKIAGRKIYYRAEGEGLWVASIDGANPVQIETEECTAMTIDLVDNRIYWAVANEVRYMPLVGSDNNRFVTEPQTINTLGGVTRIATDN